MTSRTALVLASLVTLSASLPNVALASPLAAKKASDLRVVCVPATTTP
jgi:hypothetical protein